jgi:hypothetical protein
MRRVRTLALTLLALLAILSLWKGADPQETVFGAPRDAIPAVDDPTFRDPEDVNELLDDHLMVGVAFQGEAKAYPVIILDWHEVVNDMVGDVPIVVTYCPLCGSGLVFDRRVNDDTLTFGVSGLLYKNDLVMYDRETESQWVQLEGRAIRGPMDGSSLTLLNSRLMAWGDWRDLYPHSTFMEFPDSSRPYGDYPYGDYRESEQVSFPREFQDGARHPKEIVLGVTLDNESVAYPRSVMSAQENWVTNDVVGGIPVVVTYYNGVIAAFHRGNHTFAFSDGFSMVNDQGRWNMVTGAGDPGGATNGSQLAEVPSVSSYWFAWVDFHEDSRIYGVAGASVRSLGVLESYWAVLLAAGALGLAPLLHRSRWLRDRAVREGTWVDLSRSHWYGVAAIVLGSLVAWYGLGDLRWTNAVASIVLGVTTILLGGYLVGERAYLGELSVRFTGLPPAEAESRVLVPPEGRDRAEKRGGAILWPRTRVSEMALGKESFYLGDDWSWARNDGRARTILNLALWWEEEE